MLQLKTTPFHERTSALCQPQNWRKWAGYFAAGSYEHTLDREYWAIRNAAALIDVSPLIKYVIKGKDAAALLHRVTTRNIHKMNVGQVFYTGWCDEEGKMIDDGTVTRFEEQTFRLTCRGTESALADDECGRHGRGDHRSHGRCGGAQFSGTEHTQGLEYRRRETRG
jgi:glycine cleavage system aminomethyltransferase T